MAIIYCFSSTGNSLYVAKKIAERINADVFSMSKKPKKCLDDVIGFVFPAYFWGVPLIVERFIKNIEIENKKAYIFTIVTYGGVTKGTTGAIKKLLKKKKLKLSYSKNLKSVENYLPMYAVNNDIEIHQTLNNNLKEIINDIFSQKTNVSEFYTCINTLIYSKFPGKDKNSDTYFSISDTCNQCKICEKICPVNNIVIKDNKHIFNHQCEHCLACVHACPSKSINWKNQTQEKDRYLNPHIELNELISFNNPN